jgi:hypothetical protein
MALQLVAPPVHPTNRPSPREWWSGPIQRSSEAYRVDSAADDKPATNTSPIGMFRAPCASLSGFRWPEKRRAGHVACRQSLSLLWATRWCNTASPDAQIQRCTVCRKWRRANSLPEPVFKYRSNAIAGSSSSNSITTSVRPGRWSTVDRVSPSLWAAIRAVMLLVMPT